MNSVKFTFTQRKRLIKKFPETLTLDEHSSKKIHGVICHFISYICVNLVLQWVCVYCVCHVCTYVYVFWEYHVACNTHEFSQFVVCFWIFLPLCDFFYCWIKIVPHWTVGCSVSLRKKVMQVVFNHSQEFNIRTESCTWW